MEKILIYRDEGAHPLCVRALFRALRQENIDKHYAISYVDCKDLHGKEWQYKTRLLIFPGGRDIPYDRALKGSANQHIRQFVLQGGSYLGICAGGYYGCAKVEFEKGNPLEVIEDRELQFFPGIAQGPAYGPGEFCYQSEKGARIALLDLPSGKSAAYYNGGCVFLDAKTYSHVQVLACYRDIIDQPAAIIQCYVGRGRAILCGVHPEYSGYSAVSKDPFFTSLLPQLQQIEAERKALFNSLLQNCVAATSQDVKD